eukprot:4187063-Pleurochrysis_carterae.AAC.1
MSPPPSYWGGTPHCSPCYRPDIWLVRGILTSAHAGIACLNAGVSTSRRRWRAFMASHRVARAVIPASRSHARLTTSRGCLTLIFETQLDHWLELALEIPDSMSVSQLALFASFENQNSSRSDSRLHSFFSFLSFQCCSLGASAVSQLLLFFTSALCHGVAHWTRILKFLGYCFALFAPRGFQKASKATSAAWRLGSF